MHHSEKHIAEREFNMRETNTVVIEPAITNKNHDSNITYFDFGVTSKLKRERTEEMNLVAEQKDVLAIYREYKESSESFTLIFDKISENGDLSLIKDGVVLFLPNMDSKGRALFNPTEREARLERLSLSYPVQVKEINEAENLVTLSTRRLDDRSIVVDKINGFLNANKETAERIKRHAKDRVRYYIKAEREKFVKMSEKTVERYRLQRTNEEIVKGYKRSGLDLITVPAKVKKVEEGFLICDIMGLNIPAKMYKNEWSYTMVGSLENRVQPGDVIDVCVYARSNNKTAGGKLDENKALYLVTRLPLIENPWDHLVVKKDDCVKVTCTAVRATSWYGIINGMELEVYGEYAQDRGITVRLGDTYICHVYRCAPEMRTIRVRPIELVK